MPRRTGNDPAELQQNVARSRFDFGRRSDEVANRRTGHGHNWAWSGETTPQVFTQHPRLTVPDPNEVGVAQYTPTLVGNVPASGWDGESSASAPVISKAV